MILPLRKRHRRIFIVMGVFLPAIFLAGVAARKPLPVLSSSSESSSIQSPGSFSAQWTRDDLFPAVRIKTMLLSEVSSTGRLAFQFSSPGNFLKPDLLLYWIEGTAGTSNSLPEDSILL